MILTAEKLFLASTMIGSSDEEILIQGLKKQRARPFFCNKWLRAERS
jgi:hypothetical protein